MRNRFIFLLFSAMLLAACQTVSYRNPPVNEPSTDATIRLAEAAVSISDSMHEMAVVEKVMTPPVLNNSRTIPNVPDLQTRASIDWSGPIEELVERIAQTAHYRFHLVGKRPPIPILISITVREQTLVDILRNVDYQADNKASIRVYPGRHLVELRYAKIYP